MSRTGDTHPPVPARLLPSFMILMIVLYAAYLVRTISDAPQNALPHAAIGAIFAGASVLLAWLARRAWGMSASQPIHYVLVAVLVDHALFGVVILVQRIRTEVTTNEDLAHRPWPHVVAFVNALE